MTSTATVNLPAMTLNAARAMRAKCPQHGEAVKSCVTTWDADTGQHAARIVFACGCQGVAAIKEKR